MSSVPLSSEQVQIKMLSGSQSRGQNHSKRSRDDTQDRNRNAGSVERQSQSKKQARGSSQDQHLVDSSANGGRGNHYMQNAVHEAIIDLYLQVKIRSNDEVSALVLTFVDRHF